MALKQISKINSDFGRKWVLIMLIGLAIPGFGYAQNVQDVYNKALAAIEKGDHTAYLNYLLEADSLRPNHRVILYRLAMAYGLNNDPESALEILNYRADFYAIDDFTEDSVWIGLVSWKDLETLSKKISLINEPVKNAHTEIVIDRPGFHPEGIAYSAIERKFYLSDVRCGEILSVNADGSGLEQVLDLKELGYWGGMGMLVDPLNQDQLWIASSALPNYCAYEPSLEGKSAIIKYDLKKQEVIYEYNPEGGHVFGDLIRDEQGTIYFTDSINPLVYMIPEGKGEPIVLYKGPSYWNLQGLTVNGDHLYISDYITGIHLMDLKTRLVKPLISGNQLLRGTDGMVLANNHIYMMQNGTRPMKVSSIRLLENGLGDERSYTPLESGVEALNEPTLGVRVGSEIYFIYNSPWAFYGEGNVPDFENWPLIKISRVVAK